MGGHAGRFPQVNRDNPIAHVGRVHHVAVSPDGGTIASVCREGRLVLWDAQSCAARLAITTPHWDQDAHRPARIYEAAFHPSAPIVVTAGQDGAICVWNTKTGTPIGDPLRGHTDRVHAVAFHPDGQTLVSTCKDGSVLLWDTSGSFAAGTHRIRCIQTLAVTKDPVFGVAVDPLGERFAVVAADNYIRLYSWDGQPCAAPIPTQFDSVADKPGAKLSVAFHPGGKWLATASHDSNVLLWDTDDFSAPQITLRGHQAMVLGLAFCNRDELVTSSWDGTLIRWRLEEPSAGEEPFAPTITLVGHNGPVYSVCHAPKSDVLASAGWDFTVRFWDRLTGTLKTPPVVLRPSMIHHAAINPTATLISSADRDGEIRLWDIDTCQPIRHLEGHADAALMSQFSPDGTTLASAGFDGTAMLWDVATGQRLAKLEGHSDVVPCVAFHQSGKMLATSSRDKTIRLWNLPQATPAGAPLTGHQELVRSIVFSPDGKWLASAGKDCRIGIWDIDAHERSGDWLCGHDYWVMELAWAGDMIASAGQDGQLLVWSFADRSTACAPIRDHQGPVFSVAFAPGGKLLATGGYDGQVFLYTVEDYQPVRTATISAHGDTVHSLQFTPDGKSLLSASKDGGVCMWCPQTGALLKQFLDTKSTTGLSPRRPNTKRRGKGDGSGGGGGGRSRQNFLGKHSPGTV